MNNAIQILTELNKLYPTDGIKNHCMIVKSGSVLPEIHFWINDYCHFWMPDTIEEALQEPSVTISQIVDYVNTVVLKI